jgi:hypothetical protein
MSTTTVFTRFSCYFAYFSRRFRNKVLKKLLMVLGLEPGASRFQVNAQPTELFRHLFSILRRFVIEERDKHPLEVQKSHAPAKLRHQQAN